MSMYNMIIGAVAGAGLGSNLYLIFVKGKIINMLYALAFFIICVVNIITTLVPCN